MKKQKKSATHVVCDPHSLFMSTGNPLLTLLFVGFLIIFVLGYLFGRGSQIYSYQSNDSLTDLECQVLNDVNVNVVERQVRIEFNPVSDISFYTIESWRLFRVKIQGPYFSQEFRQQDQCGLYQISQKGLSVHFELNQEGHNNIQVLCLDSNIRSDNYFVQPYDRDLDHSIFHFNNEFEKLCYSDDHFVFFTQSNMINHQNSILGNNAQNFRQKYSKYITDHSATRFSDSYMPHITNFEKMTLNHFIFNELFPIISLKISSIQVITPIETHGVFKNILDQYGINYYTSENDICFDHLRISYHHSTQDKKEIFKEYDKQLSILSELNSKRDSHIVIYVRRSHFDLNSIPDHQFIFSFFDEEDHIQSPETLLNLSNAYALICEDDETIAASFLMPQDSPTIVLLPPGQKEVSDQLKYLMEKRKVILISGEENSVQTDDDKVKSCIKGDNSKECYSIFQEMKFKVNGELINKALSGTN